MEKAAALIRQIYSTVAQLEEMFPGRRFTPDGHMVGSIGEAWAKWMYDLELLPASFACHDAKAGDGRLVQIKATQGRLASITAEPQHLIVLKLRPDGMVDEVYNGPGAGAWAAAGKLGKHGYRQLSLARLRTLMATVEVKDRLPRVRSLGPAEDRVRTP